MSIAKVNIRGLDMTQWVQHLLYTLCLNTHSLDKAGYSYVHL